MAIYDYNTLGLKNMLVVDDVTTFGKGVADNFQKKFEALGGNVIRVGAAADTTDFNPIITDAKTKNPDGVYYGGVVTSGAGLLLKQLRQQGLTIPFTGPDGIVNGAGDAKGSLIQIAGAQAADNSYGTLAAIGDFPGKADFDAAYTEHFKADADFKTPGAYSGPAYACATVVLDSLKAVLVANASADQAAIREGVRAYASDPSHSFETVLGHGVVRQERRHHPAVHLLLQVRPDRQGRRGRLGVQGAAELRRQIGRRNSRTAGGLTPSGRSASKRHAAGQEAGCRRIRFRGRRPPSSRPSSASGSGRICSFSAWPSSTTW